MLRVSVPDLQRLYVDFARAFGATDREADIYARCYITSNLRGKDTQGLAALPLSYRRLRSGAMRFGPKVRVVSEGPGFAVVDGGGGVGQIVATDAMDLAVERARTGGVAAVWVRNTNDFGMASNFSMQPLADDFAGVAMSNGVPLVAAWGGRDPLFSTNPFSVAVPSGEEIPIVIDTSASAISHGKVILAARDGQILEDRLLVDELGHLIDDPAAFIVDAYDRDSPQRGAILPSGVKGFGWLLFVELFAGLLSGMAASKDVPVTPTPESPATMGQFLMAVNVGAVTSLNSFKLKVDDLIRSVKSSRRAEGFDAILLPGERAHNEAIVRRADGIPIREEEWAQVVEIANELGLAVDVAPVLRRSDGSSTAGERQE